MLGPMPCAAERATISTVPPGGFGTMMCNGRDGKSAADAAPATANAAMMLRALFIERLLRVAASFGQCAGGYNPGRQHITCDREAQMPRIGDRGGMEAFVRSVEQGSLLAAAPELRLTPSAISNI